jgi:Ca2+-binding EF-hand superfamily protein
MQFWDQIAAVLVVVGFASAVTAAICLFLKFTVGLKVGGLEAVVGMDIGLQRATFVNHVMSPADEHLVTEATVLKIREKLSGNRHADFTEQEEAVLHRVFELIDEKHTGKITFPKFQAALKMLNLAMSKDDAQSLFNRFDTDRSETIEFEEFRQMMLQKIFVRSFTKAKPQEEQSLSVHVAQDRTKLSENVELAPCSPSLSTHKLPETGTKN